ncbi:MAG: polyphosphate polymerase domain-containing protein [Planctomycetaceae bacterium]|nr:polyphosphate polymerase domain-containing protein [Planctomycetaceae bacterium]
MKTADDIPSSERFDAAVSPSLGSSHGAFETKFVVEHAVAVTIQDWARQHLDADPHAGGELDDGYHVNSVYLDTPNFDTFRRSPFFRRRKFRLRRYGGEATIWLELKRKRNGQVRKRRVSVTEADLSQRIAQPHDPEWDGAWFYRRLEKRQLRPVCQVTYRRFARIGTSATGPIRLTIDGDLFANGADDWQVPSAPLSGESLLSGRRIVEFKFRDALPAAFRSLIQDLRLVPTAFSKYRESVAACVPLARLVGESP